VRIYESNNPADTKVSEDGGAGGASGTRAEIPLQPMEQTMVRQAVPLQTWRSTVEQISTCSPGRTSRRSRVMSEEGCDAVGSLCCSRVLAGAVNSWREEPMLERVSWQDL